MIIEQKAEINRINKAKVCFLKKSNENKTVKIWSRWKRKYKLNNLKNGKKNTITKIRDLTNRLSWTTLC